MQDTYSIALYNELISKQWRKSGCNSGGRRVDPESLVGRRVGCGERGPLPYARGGYMPPP